MRSLVLLLLVGAALAQKDDSCACSRPEFGRGLQGMGLNSARVDSHQIRLNTLEDQIEKLAGRAETAAASNVGQAAKNLNARIRKLEGNTCSDKQFQCGGDRRQCISDILVCDGSEDCGNGADETEDVCKVRVPAGSSWEGDVFWSSCATFKSQTLRIIVTGNRRVNYFQTRVWINAVITWENEEEGRPVTRTYNGQGYYNFGKRRSVVFSPPSAPLNVVIVCDFVSDDAADCELKQLVSWQTCAKVRINKK